MDEELDRFKTQIDLTGVAAAFGYHFVGRANAAVPRPSSSVTMANAFSDDKIVIRRGADGHWTYFSVRDDRDHGTIIDFLHHRAVRGLGTIRKQLRQWLPLDHAQALQRQLVASPRSRDPDAVRRKYAVARAVPSRYLLERGIHLDTLRHARFAGTFRVDRRGNVLFPHTDPTDTARIVGFEIKNRGFTGFSSGGRKAMWQSAAQSADDRLIIVEATIDAFSYHQLCPHPAARYVSTGGAIGANQLEIVRTAITLMAPQAEIVLATDNDSAGHKLAGQIASVADRPTTREIPPIGKDWNDYLQSLDHPRTVHRGRDLDR